MLKKKLQNSFTDPARVRAFTQDSNAKIGRASGEEFSHYDGMLSGSVVTLDASQVCLQVFSLDFFLFLTCCFRCALVANMLDGLAMATSFLACWPSRSDRNGSRVWRWRDNDALRGDARSGRPKGRHRARVRALLLAAHQERLWILVASLWFGKMKEKKKKEKENRKLKKISDFKQKKIETSFVGHIQ